MPNKKLSSLYPNPKSSSTFPSSESKSSASDFSSFSFISTSTTIILIIILTGVGYLYYNHRRVENTKPIDVALAVAKKVDKFDPAEPYKEMQTHINNVFEECESVPVLTITHYYQAKPANSPTYELTTVDLNEKNISNIIKAISPHLEAASKNDLDIVCPT